MLLHPVADNFAEFTHANTTHACYSPAMTATILRNLSMLATTHVCWLISNDHNDFVEFTRANTAHMHANAPGNGHNDFVEFTHASTTHVHTLLYLAMAAMILWNLPMLATYMHTLLHPAMAAMILWNLPMLALLTHVHCCTWQ